MKIFIAGATGALGRRLVPMLVAAGHEVTGMTRTSEKAAALREQGAEAVVADALDRDAVVAAVAAAHPDVVVHQLTAIAALDIRNPTARSPPPTGCAREGTDILLAAARAAGARRFVAQSYAGWPFAREGGPVKAEDAPLDPAPPTGLRETHAAIRHLERAVTGATDLEGIVLRYGGFYGPGTGLARGADQYEAVRARKFPLVGDGGGDLVARAHRRRRGRDGRRDRARRARASTTSSTTSPAPVREWLPALAAAAGAKPPRRVPRRSRGWLSAPRHVAMMTEIRGASNAKARRELGWKPAHRAGGRASRRSDASFRCTKGSDPSLHLAANGV